MDEELSRRVIAILASVKRVPPETISPTTSLTDLGVDSLDKINVLFELESEFNIDIPDEEAEKLRTVGDAMKYLHEKMGK